MTEFEGQVTETMEEALNSVQETHVGDTVKGEVLAIEDKQVIVAILGTGLEGVIPAKELSTTPTEDLESLVKVGDELDLVVISRIGKDKESGSYLLSKRRLDAKKLWEEIESKYAIGEIVDAPITHVVKGGLVADLGIRAFIPASMVEDYFVKDLSKYKGQTLKCKIVEIEPSENRLILSHKAVAEEEKQQKKQAVFASINTGDQLEGTVARLTNFGAFIDLGGVDGLVHVSEISHTHVAKASDVLKVGEKVNVLVLFVDPASDRISLSIKDTLPGPWDNIDDKVQVSSVLKGTVKRLTSFGAFIELFPGVEGLVHISQIVHKHIATPHEVLKEGEEVNVKVLEVSPESQRIALSIKALEEKPEQKTEEVVAEEESYELPEESTGFTMEDILGKVLKTEE